MEHSIEKRALKSSLRSEVENQQLSFEDSGLLGLSGAPSLAGFNVEEFRVDDLFDFSIENEDGSVEGHKEEDDVKDSPCLSSQEEDSNSNPSGCFSGITDDDPIFAGELAVPDDDIAGLEWVSHFVDDSVPELSFWYPSAGKWKPDNHAKDRSEPGTRRVFLTPPCFPSPVPVKTRTKRSRPAKKERSLASESSSTSSCSSENSSSSGLSFTSVLRNMDFSPKSNEPQKKKKRMTRPALQTGSVQFQRRCTHCQVQKTPQWRTGPLGPKTLCNACGVRYKSGRLFPEYRPACSPTFSVDVHSNSHRKVLEMRRKKEIATGMEGGSHPTMLTTF